MQTHLDLPIPDDESLAHSARLLAFLRNELQKGPMTFARYMQLALYEPGLGYYASGTHKLGEGGDFTTAPLISSQFSYALANQVRDIFQSTSIAQVIEFGAGTGQMALDILRFLQSQNALPARYGIVEISPDLVERQKALFMQEAPELLPLLHWYQQVPEHVEAVVLANELFDAMPCELFRIDEGLVQQGFVEFVDNVGQLEFKPATASLKKAVQALALDFPDGYISEVNLFAASWLSMLYQALDKGVGFFIDYGFHAREYYHADRTLGTLMCHYQQLAHSNPFFHPGLCDITAHVDFSLLAHRAHDIGFDVLGYSNQANFLIDCDILNLQTAQDEAARLSQAKALQKLLMPHEMGELFKVLAVGKNVDVDLMGFATGNMVEKL